MSEIILSDSSDSELSEVEQVPAPRKLVRKPAVVVKPANMPATNTKPAVKLLIKKSKILKVEEPESDADSETEEIAAPAEPVEAKKPRAKRTKAELDELEKMPLDKLSPDDLKAVKRRLAARKFRENKKNKSKPVDESVAEPEPTPEPEPEPTPEPVKVPVKTTRTVVRRRVH